MYKAITKGKNQSKHPVPYVMYKAITKGKSWQRVDVAICLTMTIVCFGFSTILFIGYFKVYPSSPYFLHAATASLILSILYCLNALMTTRQLQSGTIDFSNDTLFATISSKNAPLSVDTSYGNESTIPANNLISYNLMQNQRSLSRQQEDPAHIIRPRIPTEDSSDENFRLELNETLKTIEFPSDSEERSKPNMSGNSDLWYYDSTGKREFYRHANWSSMDSTAVKEASASAQINTDPNGLDARERYIKAKQYRDFMDPSGSLSWNKRQAYAANLNKMENFNEKFAASGHSSGSESELHHESRLNSSSTVPENYKPSTQPYTRRPIIPAFSSDVNNRRISESSVTESISSTGGGGPASTTSPKQPASILKPSIQKTISPTNQKKNLCDEEFHATPAHSYHDETINISKNQNSSEEILPSTSYTTQIHPEDDSTYSVVISPRPYKARTEHNPHPTPRSLQPSTSDCEVGPASSTSSYEEVSREDSPECDKSTTLVFFRGRKSPTTTKLKQGSDEDNLQISTTESSLASTIRLDDYETRYYSPADQEVQAALSTVVNFNTEPIPPIASNIDSNRENEMRRDENLQRTSSRVRKRTGQKRGFDVMIRPKSGQFRSDTNDKSSDSNQPHNSTQF
uniref:Uncharacterized protein n=1 Tax=Acrobeloides nanus TaxID=290746 RepID=A0A914BXU8_9BILA